MDQDRLEKLIKATQAARGRLESTASKPNQPDKQTAEEEKDLDKQKQLAEIERLYALNAGLKSDIKQRALFAGKIFKLIVGWLIALIIIILLQGFAQYRGTYFHLDKEVILAFIGGTTINVLGLFGIVVAYLFKK
jgi:hypothetical protein